jgi:hypothetical protein
MDRLAEQVVAWHNRHPLAKRITIYDVHTIGVVALPFMRSGPATPASRVEPVLSDELSAEDLAIAAAFSAQASHETAPNHPELPGPTEEKQAKQPFWKAWAARPGHYWAALRAKFGQRSSAQPAIWPAFTESFITGLSPKRIAAFAKDHGYTSLPGGPDWPQRIVPFDDGLMAGSSAAAGAWPFELYLLSAGIDAGSSRSRTLLGQGRPSPVLGRRCLSPQRLGLAGLLVVGLIAAATGLFWPRSKDTHADAASAASAPATAASAASAAASAPAAASEALAGEAAAQSASAASANRAVSAEPSASQATPSLASLLASAASAPKRTAEVPETAPAADAASEPAPDIRPQFVKPIPKRPSRSLHTPEPEAPPSAPKTVPAETKADAKSSSKTSPRATPEADPAAAEKPSGKPTGRASKGEAAEPISKASALGQTAGASGQTVVALVGPTSRSRGEAESMLLRMRTLIEPTQANPAALQAQVFQTPDGWRPAVWPFASREEAQLINATLIARGLRVKAVDF